MRTSKPRPMRHASAASGPIPKFVSTCHTFRYELRNLRTTSTSMILVRFLNLKFLNELAASDRNFKFTALVRNSGDRENEFRRSGSKREFRRRLGGWCQNSHAAPRQSRRRTVDRHA